MKVTINTLDRVSAQAVFNTVKKHLLAQNERAMCENSCVYLSPYGLKCAAGCLIPKKDYKPSMENVTWPRLAGMLGTENHKDLISRLQKLHDLHNPESWPMLLEQLAREKNLRYE